MERIGHHGGAAIGKDIDDLNRLGRPETHSRANDGTTMMSYPLHIYQEWMQRFFTFVIPTALIIYYPALYFFGKADPTGLLPIAQFVAPVAGFGMLAIAFGVWRIGVRHYQGTGT